MNWFDTEAQARREMADMVKRDSHRHHHARGQVRLLNREIGELVEVENPYDASTTTETT